MDVTGTAGGKKAMRKDNVDFQLSYDEGKDAHAHVSTEPEYLDYLLDDATGFPGAQHMQDGLYLGFYSSYELHEISDEGHRLQVEALRAKYPQR